MVCPITNTDKNHPFHVRLGKDTKTQGVVLCDQIKALDIAARGFEYVEQIPKAVIFEVIDTINNFTEIEE